MEVEQRSVIKFLADEGTPGIEIVSCLRNHDGEHAHSRTQGYWWINEIKRERTDLNTIAVPEEIPMKDLVAFLPVSWMPTPISRRESCHIPWRWPSQQFVAI
jgi:hypothetical protein